MVRMFSCAAHAPSTEGAGGPQRVTGRKSLTIDMHCHAQVLAAEDLVKDVFSIDLEPFIAFASEASREVNRQQMDVILPKMTSVDLRLEEMDRMGVDMQVVAPSPFQYCYWTEPELGREVARTVNDGLAEMAASNPERLVALGSVPLQAPDLAVAELDRCVKELGMKGVEISTNVAGKELTRSGLDRFFARAEELDVVIFIHPHGFTDARRLSDHYFNNVIGNPMDSTIAVSHLIFDGVLERYPGLKICVAHGGGFLAAYSARMDHAYHARSDCRREISAPPTTYLRKLYFDTVVFSADQLSYLIEQYGADHIVLGTDFPYDMGESDPVGHVGRVDGLSEADRAAIQGGNAARLLKLADR